MRKEKGAICGFLTLLELLPERNKHGHKQWLCRCECGKNCVVTASHLRRNSSCGCRANTNLIGKRNGRLVVVERLEAEGKNRLYRCKCDCGSECVQPSRNLRDKTGTQSCGCLAKEKGLIKLPTGESAFNSLLSNYKLSAKRRHIEFKLTKEEFRTLTLQPCHYCGAQPGQTYKPRRSNGEYVYSGIDRQNSTKGYTTSNCVSCCGICNKMKMELSTDVFLGQVKKIVQQALVAGG
jgi:hypothetical protein